MTPPQCPDQTGFWPALTSNQRVVTLFMQEIYHFQCTSFDATIL